VPLPPIVRLPQTGQAPDLAWTTFASALNARIWQLNRA
jgi:hypothetical protein